MSSFAVTIETIAKAEKHPNADRLTICHLQGVNFQFVTNHSGYKEGDKVLYFPIDSVLPADVIEKLGLSGLLAGPQKNRVKTISLRGAISQGVVCPPEVFYDGHIPPDIAKDLGVTKYDPPIELKGNYLARPISAMGISVYDIEGADRFPAILKELEDKYSVYIAEKIEGMNVSVQLDETETIRFAIRTLEIIDGEEPSFLRQVVTPELEKNIRRLKAAGDSSVLTLRGELIGPAIQGNYYGLKQLKILFFDILVDGAYLPSIEFLNFAKAFQLPIVPTVAFGVSIEGFLAREGVSSLKDASNFKSALNPSRHAEGLVVKPAFQEGRHREIGRLVLKQRSPVYLAAEK